MGLGPSYPIVIQSGLSSGTPSTIGNLPQFSGASPPDVLIDSILRSVGTPASAIVVGTTDPQAAAAETFRTVGGIISEKSGSADSLILGRATGTVATQAVALGTQATAPSSQNVAVGYQANATGAGSLVIGGQAATTGNAATAVGTLAGAGLQAVAIGNSTVASGTQSIAIGETANVSVTAGICIGRASSITGSGAGSIVIGANVACAVADSVAIVQGGTTVRTNWAVIHGGTPTNLSSAATPLVIVGGGAMTVTHAGNIVLGHGFTSFAANVCAIGGTATNSFIGTVVVGRGNTHTASLGGLTIRGTDGVTTNNLAMGDLTVIAPRGTGNATPGDILLQVGVQQAAGNTSQTARTGVGVRYSGAAGDTYLTVFDVDTGALQRVSVGAANSGGVGFKLLRIPN